MQQWGFIFVSFCFILWSLYALCIHDVGRPYFLFSRLSLASVSLFLFSLAFRVAAHEQSPFVMVVKPVLLYLIFVFLCYLFLPFPFSLSPVLSLHCNLLTWILSTLWPLPYLFFCHECSAHINSMSMSEPLECHFLFLFLPSLLVLLPARCCCSASPLDFGRGKSEEEIRIIMFVCRH